MYRSLLIIVVLVCCSSLLFLGGCSSKTAAAAPSTAASGPAGVVPNGCDNPFKVLEFSTMPYRNCSFVRQYIELKFYTLLMNEGFGHRHFVIKAFFATENNAQAAIESLNGSYIFFPERAIHKGPIMCAGGVRFPFEWGGVETGSDGNEYWVIMVADFSDIMFAPILLTDDIPDPKVRAIPYDNWQYFRNYGDTERHSFAAWRLGVEGRATR